MLVGFVPSQCWPPSHTWNLLENITSFIHRVRSTFSFTSFIFLLKTSVYVKWVSIVWHIIGLKYLLYFTVLYSRHRRGDLLSSQCWSVQGWIPHTLVIRFEVSALFIAKTVCPLWSAYPANQFGPNQYLRKPICLRSIRYSTTLLTKQSVSPVSEMGLPVYTWVRVVLHESQLV